MKDLQKNAEELAQAHRKSDPLTKVIKFFPGSTTNEIRLLEVSDSAPTAGEVLPFSFRSDPSNGVDYLSTVILLSMQEWKQIQEGQLHLPQGWDITGAMDLF
jgi:hypothetical protein